MSDIRFRMLVKLGSLICPSYRFKWHQLDWLNDRAFNAYLARFGEANGFNSERRWMLRELMRLIETVPGHTAECGVYEGAGSFLMCHVNQTCNLFKRVHHIFDSFEGLSEPTGNDGSHWHQGDMARGEDLVRQNLAEFSAYELHKGWIPECFTNIAQTQFAFVHIDVDLYQPTLDSLRFFYERVGIGGIIVCDDYGFWTCPGATQAVDEFLADKPEKMLVLPGGGGFLIKGTATSS